MATGGLGNLTVTLGLDAAEFTRGLTKAEADAAKFQANLVKLGSQIGTAIGVGLAAAVAGITALTKSSIDAADKLYDLSKATGVSVEQLGGIGFAAKQSGSDLEGAAQAFGKLNLKIAEAARGEKEASEAFQVLGISVKDAAGNAKTADKIFSEIATAFEGYADGPEKAALGNALFGKSYQAILPLLADGGRALQDNIEYYQRFGGVTTETARAADAFNDTLGKLDLVVGQLGRNLASELLPPLQAVADEFLRVAESSGAFSGLAKAARVAFEAIAVLGLNVIYVFQGIGREIGARTAQLQALAQLDLKGFSAISDALAEDNRKAERELDRIEQRILGLAAGPSLASRIGTVNPDRELERLTRAPRTAPRLSGPGASGGRAPTPPKEEIDEATRAYASYVQGLAAGLEKEQELSAVQKATLAIEQNRFGALIPQQKEVILYLAQQTDEQAHYNAIIRETAEMEARVAKAQDDRLKRIEDLTGRTAAKKELEDLKLLDEALRDSIITLEEFAAAQNKIAGFDKELEKANDAAEELGLTFSSALEDAIVDFTNIRDVVKGLEQDLLRIGTRKLVTEPLANWATEFFKGFGGSGGGGGGFGAILGSLFGGGGQSLTGVFASGTDFLPRDGFYFGHRGEKIVPAHENKGNGGGQVINATFVLPPGGYTRATQDQIASDMGRAVNRASRRLG